MRERDDDATGHANRRRFVKALGALGVVGLAGCGGGGDSTDSPTDTTTAPEETTDPVDTDTDTPEPTDPMDTPEPTDTDPMDTPEPTDPMDTDTPTDSMDTPTDTPSESLGMEPAPLISLSGTTAAANSTTTLSGTLTNPYLFDVHMVEVSMSAPNGDWTVEATGETSFDTIDAGGERSVSWNVTVPEGASGDFTLPVSVSYESATDSADLSLEQSVTVFTPGEAPADGLIAYFPLDSAPPTNVVDDSQGSTGGNVTTDASGVSNGAYEFDGSDDYAALPEFGSEASSVSVSMWVNTGNWGGGETHLLFWGGPVPEHTGLELWMPEGTGVPEFIYWDGEAVNVIAAAGSAPPTGEWVHLCATYDADTGTGKMYVNGEEVGGSTTQVDVSLDPVDTWLGAHPQNDGIRFFQGRIDEVRIYDRALSATEVASIASG